MMYIKNTIQDFVIKFKTNDLNMGEIDFTAEENESSPCEFEWRNSIFL